MSRPLGRFDGLPRGTIGSTTLLPTHDTLRSDRLPQPDDTGVVKPHHSKCVLDMIYRKEKNDGRLSHG